MTSWTPDELSFLAEQEAMVEVTPRFRHEAIEFMEGQQYGPFQPGIKTEVPLWLALFFHHSGTCTIVPPSWLNEKTLTKMIKKEHETEGLRAVPHMFYLEIAFAFFKNAPNTIDKIDICRSKLEDLWIIRTEKIRKRIGLELTDIFFFKHMTRMELHYFREPLSKLYTLRSGMEDVMLSLRGTGESDNDGY